MFYNFSLLQQRGLREDWNKHFSHCGSPRYSG
ncbi:hypothetical protein Gotur_033430 [Gossypium turneri]